MSKSYFHTSFFFLSKQKEINEFHLLEGPDIHILVLLLAQAVFD